MQNFEDKLTTVINALVYAGCTVKEASGDNLYNVTVQLGDGWAGDYKGGYWGCLLYTSPSPRDQRGSRMPSYA